MRSRIITPIAIGPMLLSISISALVPCDTGVPAGGAPLSACNAKRTAAVRIGIHLSIHGIRRDGPLQVIDLVPPEACAPLRKTQSRAVHAMLRSDSSCESRRIWVPQGSNLRPGNRLQNGNVEP